MSATVQIEPAVTIAEFDAFLDNQSDAALWELVAGHIMAMTNPTDIHEKIVSNIGTAIAGVLDGRHCNVFFGGMRVQRSDDTRATDKPCPDIVVNCGALRGRNYVTDALIVVEILSPSTIDVDRGDKLRFYKGLPTMRHIALVYQDQMRIELYDRTDRGWEMEFLSTSDAVLHFDAVRFEMPLRQAYFGIEIGGAQLG